METVWIKREDLYERSPKLTVLRLSLVFESHVKRLSRVRSTKDLTRKMSSRRILANNILLRLAGV